MNIEYKGIIITQAEESGRFFFDGGNPTGYTTLNTAKGAVTRMLAKPIEAHDEQPSSHAERIAESKAHQARFDAMKTGFSSAVNPQGNHIANNPKLAYVYAQLDYAGMQKNKDTRSRNKREGKYAGKLLKIGKHCRAGKWGTAFALKGSHAN